MTTKEMIEIMQAFEDGKEIEFRRKVYGPWRNCIRPQWDWSNFEYRIKPEPQYVPYDSVSEVDKDKWIKSKAHGRLCRVIGIDSIDNTVRLDWGWCSLKELLDEYTYEDDTHCGKKVET